MISSPRRHPVGRRWWAGAAVLGTAAAAAVLAAGASPALAANDYLELSLDGKTYSATTSGPVFSKAFTYSPGASSTAALWIRNTSNEPASLSAAAVVVRSAPELDGYLGLSAGSRTDFSTRSPLGAEGSCTDVEQTWTIGAGQALKLDLAMDLSAEAPNNTMNRTADIDLLFLLEPAAAGHTARPACDALPAEDEVSTGPGVTPGTGVAPGPATGIRPGSLAGAGSATASPPAQLTAVSGFRTSPAAAGPARAWTAGMAADTGVEAGSRDIPKMTARPPADIRPAGFQSTVEPIIRSLPGTLLIGMSVVFTAAVVLHVRSRQA